MGCPLLLQSGNLLLPKLGGFSAFEGNLKQSPQFSANGFVNGCFKCFHQLWFRHRVVPFCVREHTTAHEIIRLGFSCSLRVTYRASLLQLARRDQRAAPDQYFGIDRAADATALSFRIRVRYAAAPTAVPIASNCSASTSSCGLIRSWIVPATEGLPASALSICFRFRNRTSAHLLMSFWSW